MKRVIKFRAYTEISNEVLGMKYDVSHNYNDTVMQFTGLLDKHGKEIYEEDILRFDRVGHFQHSQFVWIGNVEQGHDGRWVIRGPFQNEDEVEPQDNEFTVWPYNDMMEVIGNIYENPELLNEKI